MRRLAERHCHHVCPGRRDVLGVIDGLRQATGIALGLGYREGGVALEDGVGMALTEHSHMLQSTIQFSDGRPCRR
jgi:hypothetical protein